MRLFSSPYVSNVLSAMTAIELEKKYGVDEQDRLAPYAGVQALGPTFAWISVAASRYYYGDSLTNLVERLQRIAGKINGELTTAIGRCSQLTDHASTNFNQQEVDTLTVLFKHAMKGLERLATTYRRENENEGKCIDGIRLQFQVIGEGPLTQLGQVLNTTVQFQQTPHSPAKYGFSQLHLSLLKLASRTPISTPIVVENTYTLLPDYAVNLTHELGRGAFQAVYPAVDLSNDRIYACGILPISRHELPTITAHQQALMGTILQEAPHVVKMLCHVMDAWNHYYVMEFYDLGSLDKQPIALWDDILKRSFIAQLAEALAFLHQHEIVHADLKLANILARTTSKGVDFALGDLAGTTFFDSPEAQNMGTVLYMSPERLKSFFSDPKKMITSASDIWALGCICWEVLTGGPPPWFSTMNRLGWRNLLQAVEEGEKTMRVRLPEPPADSLLHLAWKMLDPDPVTRITAAKLVQLVPKPSIELPS